MQQQHKRRQINKNTIKLEINNRQVDTREIHVREIEIRDRRTRAVTEKEER